MESYVNPGSEVRQHIVAGDKFWPNNNHLPVLIYKRVFALDESQGADLIDEHFKKNNWSNSWKEGVYQFEHYHSNSHEVLGVSSGSIMLMLGGDDGTISTLQKGDVIIIPAGVVHKNVGSSEDFSCVGAYPKGMEYDIKTGKPEERDQDDKNIAGVEVPETDPIFGEKGPLLEHWTNDDSKKVLETARQF